MARATSSLPVPVSPVMRTGASEAAARPICFQMASIAALWPIELAAGPPAPGALGGGGRGGSARCRRALAQGALHRGEQEGQVEGLGDVVEGAVAHRLDGAIAVAVGGRHDHRDLAVLARRAARGAGRARRRRAGGCRAGCSRRARRATRRRASARPRGGQRAVPEALDGGGEALADPALVVDDEHRAHGRASGRVAGAAASRPRRARRAGNESSKQVTPALPGVGERAAVRRGDGARERQAEARALRLRGEEGLEQLGHPGVVDAGAVVEDAHPRRAIRRRPRGPRPRRPPARPRRRCAPGCRSRAPRRRRRARRWRRRRPRCAPRAPAPRARAGPRAAPTSAPSAVAARGPLRRPATTRRSATSLSRRVTSSDTRGELARELGGRVGAACGPGRRGA